MPKLGWVRIAICCLFFAQAAQIASAQAVSSENGLFPVELQGWEASELHLRQGILKANDLRKRILGNSQIAPNGHIERICQAVAIFQREAAAALGSHSLVTRFDVSAQRLTDQLRGQVELTPSVFEDFQGRWFGKWEELIVNHDWKTPRVYLPASPLADGSPPVSAVQFAWVGNGFGWNILCEIPATKAPQASAENSPAPDGSARTVGHFILGMVYYVAPDNPGKIVGETPLVGFADGPRRLVWITETDIFLEEAYTDVRHGECYAIAGFKHHLLSESPGTAAAGVQAIYTHQPQTRPAFKKFDWGGVSN